MKSADKEMNSLRSELQKKELQIQQLTNPTPVEPKVVKPFHDLQSAQKTRVKRKIRDQLSQEMEPLLKQRKLTIGHVVLEHEEGMKENIQVNAHSHRTFENLTAVEREKVADASDEKVVHQMSDATYAAARRINGNLPCLSHIKAHDKEVAETLPPIEASPNRNGGFVSLRAEIKLQCEYLYKIGDLQLNEPILVKCGTDATKLTYNTQACVYSVQTITSAGSDIGIIGAVPGGDSNTDLKECGPPYLKSLLELALNPVVKTEVGDFRVAVRIGGDMCHQLELFGLSKATARHPCVICVIPKNMFYRIAADPSLFNVWNSDASRTIANITNEAVAAKKKFSVKTQPLSPLPLDPNEYIANVLLICLLHLIMRIVGKGF